MQVAVMMTVEIEDVNDFPSIERGVTQAHRRFPSAAMHEVARRVEILAESQDPGRLHRKGRELRTLVMACGPARFSRERYVDDLERSTYVLFDQRVGLAPYQRVTDAARRMLAEAAALGPSYAKAAQIVALLWGEAPVASTIWEQTQLEGEQIGRRMQEQRKAVFEGGELPGSDIPPKEFVGIETDATKIDQWRRKAEHHDVHIGIAYDGKVPVGKRSVRWALRHKIAVSGVGDVTTFGQDLFVAAQTHHNICEAAMLHYASDGDVALEHIRQEHFPQARHQLDHSHISSKARDAYGFDHEAELHATLALVFGERRQEFEARIAEDMRRFPDRKTRLAELRDYLLPRWDWIFATRRLRKEHPEVAVPPHINGTGAEERAVDTLVGHRMKHRGMGWTASGAANLMRVRLRALGLQEF